MRGQPTIRTLAFALAVLTLVVVAFVWIRRASTSVEEGSEDAASAEGVRERQRPREDRQRAPRVDLAHARKAVVSGRVHDPSNRPIEGARVCAFVDTDALHGAGSNEPRCTTSGPDGHYRLDGLWPVATRIGASAAGHAPGHWRPASRDDRRAWRSGELLLAPDEVRDAIDIELTPGGAVVRGVVMDIAGGEIEGARVWSGLSVGHSDASGAFELWLAPGSAMVLAAVAGYAQAAVSVVAPTERVEMFMTPESVIVGRVVLAGSGAPVPDIEVRVPNKATRSDADGHFRLDGLEPGTYEPTAITEHLYGIAVEQVHLGFGETSDEVVIEVHELAVLAGTIVVAGTGREPQPCTSGMLTVEHASDGWTREAAIERRDGHVEIVGLLPGSYRVDVECAGYLYDADDADDADVEIEGSERVERAWQVHAGAEIRGEVVDGRGEPLEGITVSVVPTFDGEGVRVSQTYARDSSLDDGSFVIAGLPAGTYELSAVGGAEHPCPPIDPPIAVDLSHANVEHLRVVMPETGSIRGRVVDEHGEPVAGAGVVARSPGGVNRQDTPTDDAGEFVFDDLLPGRVELSVRARRGWFGGPGLRKPGTSDNDEQSETVEVRAGEASTVELVVESRGGVIRGRVLDEGGGPVSDAFVQAERMSEVTGANIERARQAARTFDGAKQPVLTDADGRFELRGLAETGQFIVIAQRKGGGEASAEGIAAGAEVELVIDRTSELGGSIHHADGRVPERVQIDIYNHSTQFSRTQTYLRRDRWRATELPAGSYTIKATGDGAMAEAEVELGAGELRNDLVLELNPLVTVTGTIVDIETREPIANMSVQVNAVGVQFHDEARVTGPDGAFEVDKVPHGSVRIYVFPVKDGRDSKYDLMWHYVRLEPTPAVQDVGQIPVVAKRLGPDDKPGDLGLTLQDARAGAEVDDYRIRVATVRPGGPAAMAGLAPGDEIHSVDGHDVTGGLAPRWLRLTRARPGTKLRLGLGDGRELVLDVGPPH